MHLQPTMDFPCFMLANLPQFLSKVDLLRTQSMFDWESIHHISLCWGKVCLLSLLWEDGLGPPDETHTGLQLSNYFYFLLPQHWLQVSCYSWGAVCFYAVLGIYPKASCMSGECSTSWNPSSFLYDVCCNFRCAMFLCDSLCFSRAEGGNLSRDFIFLTGLRRAVGATVCSAF